MHSRNEIGRVVDRDYFASLSPLKPTAAYDMYWYFAFERQEIFFKKLEGAPEPWTNDSILRVHKFTNAYRAADRVSQYLIKKVIYHGDSSSEEVFFRTILFKLFNKIETWELLTREVGEIRWSDFSFDRFNAILNHAQERGETIFSAAYIMPSGCSTFGRAQKHGNMLLLLEHMMREGLPRRIAASASFREAYEILRSYPLLGDFLAYQYAIDLNYSTIINFSENDFVVPGPGAKSGIRKCFSSRGGMSEAEVVRFMVERQEFEFKRLNLPFRSLWGRPLQLIDCQNLFCETDKYTRVALPELSGEGERTRIKQKYTRKKAAFDYWFPPKWNINQHLDS